MSYATLNTGAAPSTPASGKVSLYADSADNRVKIVDASGVTTDLKLGGDRNFVTNGGFSINQRIAAALTNVAGASTTARIFTADHWGLTVGNATTPQYQQVDTIAATEAGLRARYYARYKQLTNAAKQFYSNVVIGTEVAPLRGRTVRLQAKLRYSVGSNRVIRLGLIQLTSTGTVDTLPATFISAFNGASTDPTLGTNLAYIAPTLVESTGSIVGNAINCPITTSWQRFSGTFVVPAGCVNLVVGIWGDTVGAVNDDVLVAEVGLYDGQAIEDWTPVTPLANELGRCQRFFCKTFAQATVPAQNVGINTGEAKGIAGKAGAVANAGIIWWRFPKTMHKTPTTVTLYNPGAANALMRNLTGVADMGATAATAQLDSSVMVIATGVAATAVGDQVGIHFSVDAEV
jgi:hypothetical protein